MTTKVKETSSEVLQIMSGSDSLAESFDYDAADNSRPSESISFIKVKCDQSNDRQRLSSDFARIKAETLKAMPPCPRVPRNNESKSNKPVAVILAMEKKSEKAPNEALKDHQENAKYVQNKPPPFATLIRHKF